MRLFARLPIKQKLIWIIMLTSSVALMLACFALAAYEIASLRRSMPINLGVLAKIIGDNAKSALQFDDPRFAEETCLASLAAHPHIMAGCIYQKEGRVFARFVRDDVKNSLILPAPLPSGHYFANDHLGVFYTIVAGDKRMGTVYLQSDLGELYSRLVGYSGICIFVLVASTLVAGLMSSRLQRVISGPVLKLAETTAQVAREKNYSVRVTPQSRDELGILFDGFNKMLTEIEQRDVALQLAHRDLEKRVAARTADLTHANESLVAEVSERKRAELALWVSQQKFQTLVNSIDGLVWEADPRTLRFSFVSQQAQAMLGYSPDQWLNEPNFWQDHLHPDDRQRALDFVRQAVAQNKPYHFEYRMIAADGRIVWIRDSAAVVVEEDKPVALRGVLLDVTEQKVAEQELETLHRKLLETSRHAGMAEVATGVLHNVGNVLNSVNVSATLVCERVRQSKVTSLAKAAALLNDQKTNLGEFLTGDERGKLLPGYLASLAEHLRSEQSDMLRELQSLTKNIEHIKDIVAMQQNYARVSGVVELLPMAEVVEDAIQFNAAAFARHGIQLVREFDPVPPIAVDKHKVLQILVNLLHNAKYAMESNGPREKRLTLGLHRNGGGSVQITVRDSGIGIPTENLTRIFSHGFTTRKGGHGFGLHSGALAAKEMGGNLTAHSEGPERGAVFTLELPENGEAE